MNKYQKYIKNIERLFLGRGQKEYLCSLADLTFVGNEEESVRFRLEISSYIPCGSGAGNTLGYSLYHSKGFAHYPSFEEANSYRLLILHRMYEDANYDWWSE